MSDKAEMKHFVSREAFRYWLEQNYDQDFGIWLVFDKRNKVFGAKDALEEAICFGWIDGRIKSIDSSFYKKFFSRRKDAGNWSERNKQIYQRLQKKGLLTRYGRAVYQPKDTGKAKESEVLEHIEMLKKALSGDAEALSLFERKSASKKKQLAGFFCEAKTVETRQKRTNKIIEALKNDHKGILY